MGWSSDRTSTLNVFNVGNMAVYSNVQLLLRKKCICNSSQMCEFDAVRGGGYVLSFWRVVQDIVAGVLRLVHV